MRGVNKVIIVGNLGNDPEFRTFPNGGSVTHISVATSEAWKDKNTGEQRESTEWHRVSFFGRLSEIASQYLSKGSKVYVEGKLKTRKWTDQAGIDRYTTEIIAENLQMLGGGTKQQPQGGQGYNQGYSQQQPQGGQGYNQGGQANQGYNQGGQANQGYNQGGQANQGYSQQQPNQGNQGYNQGYPQQQPQGGQPQGQQSNQANQGGQTYNKGPVNNQGGQPQGQTQPNQGGQTQPNQGGQPQPNQGGQPQGQANMTNSSGQTFNNQMTTAVPSAGFKRDTPTDDDIPF